MDEANDRFQQEVLRRKACAGFSPFHQCAYDGDLDTMKFLLEQGQPLDARTLRGDTALSIVRASPHSLKKMKIEEWLLEEGADPYSRVDSTQTPSLPASNPGSKSKGCYTCPFCKK
jgi:ankyrin repeat protein